MTQSSDTACPVCGADGVDGCDTTDRSDHARRPVFFDVKAQAALDSMARREA